METIVEELKREPLNSIKPSLFGVVSRRTLPPDYSRMNWLRPKLYKLLMDFGATLNISYNAIAVVPNGSLMKTPKGDTFQVEAPGYKLVYYTYTSRKSVVLPPPSVRKEGNLYCFYRGEEKITKQRGLKKRVGNPNDGMNAVPGFRVESGEVSVEFH